MKYVPEPLRRALVKGGVGALTLPWLTASATAATAAPLQPRPLRFPRDHGTHNDTRTEWWYLTGYGKNAGGRLFGFQVTFFRSRIDGTQTLRSRLAARHLLFVHAAITDVEGTRLWHGQRMARWNGEPPEQRENGVFASTDDTEVVLRDWHLRRTPDGAYTAQVRSDELLIDLVAAPTQPLLLQGQEGFSRKGPDATQASFYVSHPQLAVRGTLGLSGQRFEVAGTAWLDHEWSESLLHPDAVGWDWIGMNLDDGHSLTAFQLRRQDGSRLWAGGSLRSGSGAQVRAFGPDEVRFEPLRLWTSPRTAAVYPVEWRITTAAGGYLVRAVIDPQELDGQASTGTVYWEGLSDLFDGQERRLGRGYLEMTGYAERLVL